jgi:cytochrome c2
MANVVERLTISAAAALVATALGGCTLKHPTANLVDGKQLFVAKCGACHTLSHAGTVGNVGPDLDDAFAQDRADGMNGTAIQGLVDSSVGVSPLSGVGFLYTFLTAPPPTIGAPPISPRAMAAEAARNPQRCRFPPALQRTAVNTFGVGFFYTVVTMLHQRSAPLRPVRTSR